VAVASALFPLMSVGVMAVDQWSVELAVTCGVGIDVAEFGVAPGATDGFDAAYDQPEPPPPVGDYQQAYFYYPALPSFLQKLSTSYIAPDTVLSWPLQMAYSGAASDVMIEWSQTDIGNAPAEYEFFFVADGQPVNMRTVPSHTFPASTGVYDFEVMALSNQAPTAPVVDVTPDSPLTSDNLVCTITTPSSDPDGDTVTYTYDWYRDGALQQTTADTTALTDILSFALTAEGETWSCVVTPNDGLVDGPSGTDQAVIGPVAIPGLGLAATLATGAIIALLAASRLRRRQALPKH
jgi:hypothetical protein